LKNMTPRQPFEASPEKQAPARRQGPDVTAF